MTVGALRHYFDNLAGILQPAGVKKDTLDDFAAINRGLEPFASVPLRQFADFLVKAEEYHRTGALPVTPPTNRRGGGTKSTTTTRVPSGAVVKQIVDLYERAKRPDMTMEAIESELQVLTTFSRKAPLLEIAAVLGASEGLEKKSIPDIAKIVGDVVRDMWTTARRVKM